MKRLLMIIAISALMCSQLLATPAERKAIVANHANSVLCVEVTMETSYSMEGSDEKDEQQSNATGIVIDKSGLLVVPLLMINPTDVLKQMMDSMGDSDPSTKKMLESVHVDVKKIVVRLVDGTELPATVLLKDDQTELAVIKTASPFPDSVKPIAVADGVSIDLGDDLYCLSRLGSTSKFAPRVQGAYISAKITDPKLRYVIEGDMGDDGIPAFTGDGKWAGVILTKITGRNDSPYTQLVPSAEAAALIKKAQTASAK